MTLIKKDALGSFERKALRFLKSSINLQSFPALALVKNGKVVSEFKTRTKINNLNPEDIERWVEKTLATHAESELTPLESGPQEPYDEFEDDGFTLCV